MFPKTVLGIHHGGRNCLKTCNVADETELVFSRLNCVDNLPYQTRPVYIITSKIFKVLRRALLIVVVSTWIALYTRTMIQTNATSYGADKRSRRATYMLTLLR